MTSSYTNVFGGTVIYPAEVSYRAVSVTANLSLSWPTEVSTDQNVVSQIMDVNAAAAGFSIIMPPANQVSVGETTLIFNVGSYAVTIKDYAGNTITSISPGLAWQLYVTNNNTEAGSWRPVQYGAGSSSATAGALAGSGIKAISTTLNQSAPVVSLAADYSIGNIDRALMFLWTGGAGTFTLPTASSAGNDWFCYVRNGGTGAVTLVGPGGETINGDVNLVFNPGDSSLVICDGSDFFTVGFGQAPEFTFDYVAIDLTGETSPYVLAGANLNRIAYNFSGVLTGNMIVVVPDTVQQYWVANTTTGSYSLTIANAGGTGVAVPQGARTILYCDGVDVYPAETAGLSYPIAVSQGGTGATNAATALVNLGGSATGIAAFTAASQLAARTALAAAASGANTDITALDQDVTITATGTIAADSIGYRGLPQNAQTGAYTLALSDAGKQVANTIGGFVIPANASVAFPIGTAVVLYNNSSSSQNVSITSDTLRLAGTTSTGTRPLAAYGVATVIKVDTTVWVISGAGVS